MKARIFLLSVCSFLAAPGCASGEESGVCGDSFRNIGEQCDDGNTVSGDGCSATCLSDETCGNNVVDAGEVCDDGNVGDGDGCSADCSSDESCGNGLLDPGEVCDVELQRDHCRFELWAQRQLYMSDQLGVHLANNQFRR